MNYWKKLGVKIGLIKLSAHEIQQMVWEKWESENIAFNASTVEGTFYLFKHVIKVDPNKMLTSAGPFGWVERIEFDQYKYPAKPLGENAVCLWFRCERDQFDNRHHINEMCGTDQVFVATNNEVDAIMIALEFS